MSIEKQELYNEIETFGVYFSDEVFAEIDNM